MPPKKRQRSPHPLDGFRLVVEEHVRRQVVADVMRVLVSAFREALRARRKTGTAVFGLALALAALNACGSVTTSATDTDGGTDLGSQPATGSAGTGAGSGAAGAGQGAAGTTGGAGQGAAGSSGGAGTGATTYVPNCGKTPDEVDRLHGQPCEPDRCYTRVESGTMISWDYVYSDFRCALGVCTPKRTEQCGGHNDRPCISDPTPHCYAP
jgi:hypothetical protein